MFDDKMEVKDCYESATCENYVYTFGNEVLEFLTYWDNQKIDVVTLKTKEADKEELSIFYDTPWCRSTVANWDKKRNGYVTRF